MRMGTDSRGFWIAALILVVVGGAFWYGSWLVLLDCSQRNKMVARLGDGFDQFAASRAVTDSGNLMEVMRSKAGTWSIILTLPNGGKTCIKISGTGWMNIVGEHHE